MSGYTTLWWPAIAGICLYASLIHLQIGLRRPIDAAHTLFGLLALCVAISMFANIQLATARTSSDYQAAAWFSDVVTTSVLVFVPLFATYYAEEPTHRYAAALSVLFIVLLIGNFTQPYSMLLSASPVPQAVEFPWGERIARAVTPPTAWLQLAWIAQGLTIAYLGFACVGLWRRGPRVRAWGLLLSATPFAASLVVNVLARLGFVNFPYVAAPGLLAMVVVMSVMLMRESRRTQAQMQALLDNVPAVAYLKHADGRYVFVNRRFEQLYRLASGAALGKTDSQLFDARRAEQQVAADRAVLTSATTIESEEVIEQDGKPRAYATLRLALRDDGGSHVTCGIAVDITERKAAADAAKALAATLERRIAHRTNELARLNRELEAFTYSVSHDLRAPLTAVNGFAELLLREHGSLLEPTARRYLNRIRDGALRMAALLQDLLGLSRVTQQALTRKSIDLAVLAEASLRMLRESEPARHVECALPGSLPANGDPQLLALALKNLLANAWKYTAKTTDPRIEMGALDWQGETAYFVKDNGAGFDPAYGDRLFRPFARLHSDSEFPGTGIGLATVARIVTRHGGRIWAEGKPSGGATFFFTLPASDEETPTHTATYVESHRT